MSADAKPRALLSEADRQSPLWRKLKAYFEARLEKNRARNDSPTLSEAETAALRGAIAELKHMTRLDQPVPLVEDETQFKD